MIAVRMEIAYQRNTVMRHPVPALIQLVIEEGALINVMQRGVAHSRSSATWNSVHVRILSAILQRIQVTSVLSRVIVTKHEVKPVIPLHASAALTPVPMRTNAGQTTSAAVRNSVIPPHVPVFCWNFPEQCMRI